jgi:hypothetical protein
MSQWYSTCQLNRINWVPNASRQGPSARLDCKRSLIQLHEACYYPKVCLELHGIKDCNEVDCGLPNRND